MKSFKDYLTESKKTYAFKIKVAGDLPEGFSNDLRGAMNKFSIANLTKGKSSPIQENLADFPQLKKAKLDQDAQGKDPEGSGAIAGEGVLITDRNSLLEKLRNMK